MKTRVIVTTSDIDGVQEHAFKGTDVGFSIDEKQLLIIHEPRTDVAEGRRTIALFKYWSNVQIEDIN